MPIWNVFNKRVVAYVFWALVIALAVSAFRIHQPTLKAALLPAKAVPYTVVLEVFHLQQDGTAIPGAARVMRYTYAIRSDGSRSIETMTGDLASPSYQRVLDFSSGKEMYIFSPRQLKTTMFDSSKIRAAYWLRDSGSNCLLPALAASERPEGEEVMNGYRTVKLTRGPATEWLALDYGCALVKDRYEWPDGQKSEKRLVALIPGEPAPSLFEDPAGFQEALPSRWLPPEAGIDARDGFDAYYQSHRPPASAAAPN
jgi:hypothetical protein